jgi:hypothetical protein
MGSRELTSERTENLPSTRRRVMMTEHFSEKWDVEIIPCCRHKIPRRRITTTLYTLMAALQEQVGLDDALVVAIV